MSKETTEKLPFFLNKPAKNHGALCGEKKPCEDPQNKDSGMSTARKVCFIMSFSVWALYFTAMFWFIPCRRDMCLLQKTWTITLNDTLRTSNIEFMKDNDNANVMFIGHSDVENMFLDENTGHLTAIEIETGAPVWDETVPFVPRQIRCNNSDSSDSYCSAIGIDTIAFFNSSKGNLNLYKEQHELDKEIDTCTMNQSKTIFVNQDNRHSTFICGVGTEVQLSDEPLKMSCSKIFKRQETSLHGTNLFQNIKEFFSASTFSEFTNQLLLLNDDTTGESLTFSSFVLSNAINQYGL